MITKESSDTELMAAFDALRSQACGDTLGDLSDSPREAVERANETGEVLGMTVIRTIYAGTNCPGTPVFATDAAHRLWVVNDLDGPWAIEVTA
jgi:hypothetical protein